MSIDTTSMRLIEHESEGNNEELIALIVADMQDPVPPILKAALVGEGLHDAGRMIARLNQIVHHGAAVIEENLLRVGAVEKYLGHFQPPSDGRVANRSALLASSTVWYESQIR
jgi:hypothetical protein